MCAHQTFMKYVHVKHCMPITILSKAIVSRMNAMKWAFIHTFYFMYTPITK